MFRETSKEHKMDSESKRPREDELGESGEPGEQGNKQKVHKPGAAPSTNGSINDSTNGSTNGSNGSNETSWAKVDGSWKLPQISKAQSAEAKRFLKTQGMKAFLSKYLPEGPTTRSLLELTLLLGFFPLTQGEEVDDERNFNRAIKMLQKAMNRAVSTRSRLPDFNKVSQAVEAIQNANKILVLTGAGISTSLGIPDFRSSKGIYAMVGDLKVEDPQEVFDLQTFKADPEIFYQVAHMVLPPENVWTATHQFIKLLSDKGKLLRNYTQNIDNIEATVGIPKEQYIQCHGSFATAICRTCKREIEGHKIYKIIRKQEMPVCSRCYEKRREFLKYNDNAGDMGIMKPGITFFGEDLPEKFHANIENDCRECDLVVCIGTSLKVSPVNDIVNLVGEDVPQILINKDDITHSEFDVTLLGLCDEVVTFLSDELNWELDHKDVTKFHNDGLVLKELDADVGLYAVDCPGRVEREKKQAEEKLDNKGDEPVPSDD
ncbi:CYFA0S33e00210g1_1 [Cyberlindnera fabianii]|uniref:CYFA0S33e00210g1_1 n=1 Tax=Cyberlindnera fabianii TaxID=36022 RepID=A0A061BI19_CYBFA|nr:CYFA0S33e00210g1_1 [Cyberlindnera fabianii]